MKHAAHDTGFIVIVAIVVIIVRGIVRWQCGVSERGRHPAARVLFRPVMMERAGNHINRQISE